MEETKVPKLYVGYGRPMNIQEANGRYLLKDDPYGYYQTIS
jgi:hypothetical protein